MMTHWQSIGSLLAKLLKRFWSPQEDNALLRMRAPERVSNGQRTPIAPIATFPSTTIENRNTHTYTEFMKHVHNEKVFFTDEQNLVKIGRSQPAFKIRMIMQT